MGNPSWHEEEAEKWEDKPAAEPWWTTPDGQLWGGDGSFVAYLSEQTRRYPKNLANFRRIVACVNACKGIPTETLEANPAAIAECIQVLFTN